ncbi:enolase 1-like [Magnolia sinica]|uniref:enolase 1-like n=1 Tax=Magnolia sinica TaxID=86752 RepID=UPI00265ACD83|nr:enolase 1-like [Magnolia sinica]XP_058072205.1 enolase 1-like [Magnolia sinica]
MTLQVLPGEVINASFQVTWFGTNPRVNIMDPELIREFLSNKFGHFAKQKPTAFGKQLVSGLDPTEQTGIDNLMIQQLDGIVNEWGWCKQKLGGNAILAVSLAVCKAGASVKKFPLYQV